MVTAYNKICYTVVKSSQETNIPTKTIPITSDYQNSSFKDRLYKHKNSFKYENKRSTTGLFNLIWDQKSKNIDVSLEWSILDKAKPYSPDSRNCRLCLTEKYHILFSGLNLLSKLNELQPWS